MSPFLSHRVHLFCALPLLVGYGCDSPRSEPQTREMRERAEAVIRSGRPIDVSLLCESRIDGRLLMTFHETPPSGVVTVDEDLFPMVVVDVDRGRARVVQRRPFQPDASSANARTVTAPATVDSASAVSLAKQLVGRESTLHCVIESARAFDVEMLPSAHPVGTTIRGQTVLVPRGGPVQVIGVFELPSDK